MSRREVALLMLMFFICLALGAAMGAEIMGCDQDEFGADHVFFKAHECTQPIGADGSKFLECRRLVAAGGAK